MPNLYIIAGPNGVGKTTFAQDFLPEEVRCLEFVNADLIAQGLSPFAPDGVSLRAGRIMLERLEEQDGNFLVHVPSCFDSLPEHP